MTCFVINLDRDETRLAETRAQLAPAGIGFERIRAVDARTMTDAERRAACPRFRFYLANARRVRSGEIGCALSHRKCWETVAERGLPVAAVFEDDVLVDTDRLKAHFASIEAENDPAVPTVWLMHKGLPKPESPCGGWYDIRNADRRAWVWCAHCYAVNAAAAKRLARLLTPMVNVCDAWSVFARCGVRVLAADEPSAATRQTVSTIPRKTRGAWRYGWVRRFYWFRYRIAFRLDLLLKRIEGSRFAKGEG